MVSVSPDEPGRIVEVLISPVHIVKQVGILVVETVHRRRGGMPQQQPTRVVEVEITPLLAAGLEDFEHGHTGVIAIDDRLAAIRHRFNRFEGPTVVSG
jgi:hypothetical protein